MAKTGKVKTTQKLTKEDIDSKILELLKLDEQHKAMGKRITELKTVLESQYSLDPKQAETVFGIQMYMEKVPVENGKTNYDIEKLKPFLKAIRALGKVIKRVEYIDLVELDYLVKTNRLTPEILDTCRKSSWTFRSLFKRNEEVVQSADEKVTNEKVS